MKEISEEYKRLRRLSMSDHGTVAQKGVGEEGVKPPLIFLEGTTHKIFLYGTTHRLNMQLDRSDLQSLFGLIVTAVLIG